MKKLFVGILAMAAMAACATEDTIETSQGNAIAFGNAFVDNSVRATSATDPSYTASSLHAFNVYGAVNGVNIFDGDEVSGDVGEAFWDFTDATTPKQYWISGASYKFVAVVDGNKGSVTDTALDTDTGLPTSISYTVDGETDLLCEVVTITSAVADQGVVGFTFSHLLSKVKFSVKNTTDADATNYRIVLTEAKITNTYAGGTYDVDTDTWTPGAIAPYTLENLTINSGNTEYNSTEVLLVPGDAVVGLSIKADIETTSNNGTTWKKVSEITKTFDDVIALQKAHAYHFIVELGIGKEIKFTATALEDWTNVEAIEKK